MATTTKQDEPITVAQLIKALSNLHPDAHVFACRRGREKYRSVVAVSTAESFGIPMEEARALSGDWVMLETDGDKLDFRDVTDEILYGEGAAG